MLAQGKIDTDDLRHIETPALLLDLDALERNIAKMAGIFADLPCKLRPHIKTHKLPFIARKQLEAGAIGLTCATLTEAETFLKAGLKDILIANEITCPLKVKRLAELAKLGELIVCVDDIANARELSKAAGAVGSKPGILVDINVGLNRCGVKPGAPALELASAIMQLKNVSFRGLMGYEGSFITCTPVEKAERCAAANRALTDTKDLLVKNGLPVEIVTGGGTHTHAITGTHPGITDLQVGSYATMDGRNKLHGVEFELAISVLASVISRPQPGLAITDAGMKALSSDAGLPEPADAGLSLVLLNEEHGHIRIADPKLKLAVNDKIGIIPSHGSTTIPLFNRYYGLRAGRLETELPFEPAH